MPILLASHAPLYHYMDADKALAVLATDAMPARAQHFDPVSARLIRGNSFSRNLTMGVRERDCVRLTVNQACLRTQHRLMPFDAEQAYSRYCKHFDSTGLHGVNWAAVARTARAHRGRARDRKSHRERHQWQEEFVVGDIRRLHRYVTAVEVRHRNHGRFAELCTLAHGYARRHNIPYEGWPPPPASDFRNLCRIPPLPPAARIS